MTQAQATQTTTTLYERIGGAERLRVLVGQIVDAHLSNPEISARFIPFDRETMVENAFLFFEQAMGGPARYAGRGLAGTHRGMNVSEHEFVAATDDVIAVLNRNGVGPQEQLEILGAFFAMKGDVLHL